MEDILKQYSFFSQIEWSLNRFSKAKSAYLAEKTPLHLAEMQMAYENIYSDLKSQWVYGKIQESEFWRLVNVLKEGVD